MKDIKSKVNGFIIGAAMVPLMGVGAHIMAQLGDGNVGDDYSLHNRFETAYSFNTPDAHKTYTFVPCGEDSALQTFNYMASPWATYPAMLAFGLLGAHTLAKFEEDEKRRKIMSANNLNQRRR